MINHFNIKKLNTLTYCINFVQQLPKNETQNVNLIYDLNLKFG